MSISVTEETGQRRTKKMLVAGMIGLAVVVAGAGATAAVAADSGQPSQSVFVDSNPSGPSNGGSGH